MALIGHWPLNGNLNDYSNVIGTLNNKGANIHDDGKIGKCYNTTESYQKLDKSHDKSMHNMGEVTICCFVKIENTQITERVTVVQAFGCYISIDSRFKFSSWIYGIQGAYVETDEILNRNKWYHLTLKLQDGIVYKYIDGILVQTYNGTGKKISSNDKNIHIFAENGSRQLIGKINDIRIYDEALSDKEIYDISRCKILHYTFNSTSEPTKNLINLKNGVTNLGFGSYSGYIAENDWFKSEIVYDDTCIGGKCMMVTCKKYEDLNNWSGSEIWLNNLPMKPNTKYTITFRYKTTNYTKSLDSRAKCGFWSHQKREDGTTCVYQDPHIIDTKNTWVIRKHVITNHAECVAWSRFVCGFYRTDVDTKIWLDWIQIEEGFDTQFAQYDRDGVIYDTSGFKNNSILSEKNFPKWIDNSATGVGSYYFGYDNTNTHMKIKLYVSNSMMSNFTISLWYNNLDTTNRMSDRIFDSAGLLIMRESKNSVVFGLRGVGSDYNYSAQILNDEWNNLSIVYRNKNVSFYINGIIVNTIDRDNVLINLSNLVIGDWSSLNGERRLTGAVDDIRFYSSSLSENEIKSLYDEKLNIDNKGNILISSISEHGNLVKDVSDSDFWNYKPTSGSISWGVENKYIPNENALLINSHSSAHHGHSFKLPIICDKKYRFKCRVKTNSHRVYDTLNILLFNDDVVVKTNHIPTVSNNTYTGYSGSEYKNTSIDFIIDGSNITDIQCTHFAIQLIGAGNSSSNIYIKDIELYLVDDFDMDDVINKKSLIKKHINEFGVSNNLIFNANMKMNNMNYSKTMNTHTLVDSTNNSNLVSYNGKSAYYPTGTYSDISNPLIIDGEFTILYNVTFKKDKPTGHVYTHFSIAENVINCNRNTDGILSFWIGGNPDHYHDQVVMNKQYTCAIVCRKNGDKFDYITIANDKRVETLENVKKITRLNVTINNDKDGETPSDFDEIEFSDLMIYDRGLSDEELYLQYDIVSGNKLHIRPNEIIAKKFSEGL